MKLGLRCRLAAEPQYVVRSIGTKGCFLGITRGCDLDS